MVCTLKVIDHENDIKMFKVSLQGFEHFDLFGFFYNNIDSF